ncbi:ATP-dependent RNA helicase [Actinidia chinensis var. chinensis]|uniref:ATP-dependent RNA helicase n=1 Tax=Actinidia chinensis var. chinensis TaxID=1590841 RepID=A0A2R6S0B5_ACTCC|nr:ATP-dependent RNA helicase [Actinidia chinensis var. chinensis]
MKASLEAIASFINITCKKPKLLFGGNKRKNDKLFMELAKSMNWPRCPHCKFYVERVSGCNWINCRCGIGFCYKCGREAKSCHCMECVSD